jgi:TorA maturation chaperone TorD
VSRLLTHASASAVSGKPLAAARLAELLARLFRDAPDAALLEAIDAFDTSALDPSLAEAVRRLAAAAALSDLEACRREHARLFHDPRGAVVLQWESTWTESPPRLMGRSHLEVLRAYEEAGFRPRVENEPADGIVLELGFVALLIEQRQSSHLEAFWRAHVTSWMPRLARRLREAARVPLYAAVADLLDTAIRPIRRRSMNEEKTTEAPTRIR